MFSRLSLRSGAFGQILGRPAVQQQVVAALARACSSQIPIAKHVENWEKANSIYYGPERDTKNFPITKHPEKTPPTRMGIFPESWFTALYPKTGVTGPYMLGAGVITFWLSKELWIIEHGFTEFISFWAAVFILIKKFGPGIGAYLDKTLDTFHEKKWYEPLNAAKAGAQKAITDMELNQWREEGQKYIFEVKRENVDLQLEAAYRSQLNEVYSAVKKRLDYQVQTEAAKRSFEQEHMVNWIVDGVMKGITPQQEKESLSQCMKDLKALSLRHSGTATA